MSAKKNRYKQQCSNHPFFEMSYQNNSIEWLCFDLNKGSEIKHYTENAQLYWLCQWKCKDDILSGWYYWCAIPIKLDVDLNLSKENFKSALIKAETLYYFQ